MDFRIDRWSKDKSIKSRSQKEDILSRLSTMQLIFMYAFHNRLQSSYSTDEINDFNIFFNGGTHQLTTAFGEMYKVFSKLIGNPKSLLYVAGNPLFKISDSSLKLNYFHIFNPEKLVCVVVQEISQQLPRKFIEKKEFYDIFKYSGRFYNDHEEIPIKNIEKALSWKKTIKKPFGKKTTKKYSRLASLLTPEFFDHLIGDIIGYYFLYLKNKRLYEYWCWGYFSSTSMNYFINNNKKKISQKWFENFLLRQLLVLSYAEGKFHLDTYKLELSIELEQCFDLYGENVKGFLKKVIFTNKELDMWLQDIVGFTDELFKETFGTTVDDYFSIAKVRIDTIVNKMDSGKPIFYQSYFDDLDTNNRGEINILQHTQNLLYAYLLLVKELAKNYQNPQKAIMKTSTGFKDGGILFSPSGGVYATTLELRRKLFLYRNLLHMSLWDIAVKEKSNFIKSQMNANSKEAKNQ